MAAFVDRDDPAHAGTVEAFELGRSEVLTVARRRYGPAVTADLIERVIPALEITPVDADLHAAAVSDFRDTIESSVSLVHRTSFACMRRERIERAIPIDADFRTAGFETFP